MNMDLLKQTLGAAYRPGAILQLSLKNEKNPHESDTDFIAEGVEVFYSVCLGQYNKMIFALSGCFEVVEHLYSAPDSVPRYDLSGTLIAVYYGNVLDKHYVALYQMMGNPETVDPALVPIHTQNSEPPEHTAFREAVST